MTLNLKCPFQNTLEWKDVRSYLKEYVGAFYTIAATGDVIYIGSDLPNEYFTEQGICMLTTV